MSNKKIQLSSITIRLVVTYFLVMMLMIFFVTYYILNSITGYMLGEQKLSVTTMANVVSSFALDYMDENAEYMEEGFDKFVTSIMGDEKMRVLILNCDSVVIFDSQNNHNLINKVQINPSVLTAVGGKSGFSQYKNEEKITVLDAAAPIMKYGAVAGVVNVVYSTEELSDFKDATGKDITLLTILVSLIVGIIIYIVANLVTKRIVNFTNTITSMSRDGILDEKLDIRGNDEISRLAVAFNEMSDKVVKLEHKRVEFVSNASHELKTPLSSIKLMADSILQTEDLEVEYVREFLIDMNSEVDRLNRIVNKLLYITKMDTDAEKLGADMDITGLSDVLLGIEKNLTPIANRDEITLSFNVQNEVYVMANKDMLWQGIYNIVDNAIKYSNEFGKVDVTLYREKDKAIILVKDNGVGISSEDIEKIFERFYRVDKARSRETGGTGLGLSIALSAIEFHGGTIEVKSEPNIGSEFKIILPAF